MPQISVIVLTYNPDNFKLRRTLAAVAQQLEVDLELIISDDGSVEKDFSFLPEFMASLGVNNYLLLEHKINRGTVQSCRSAVAAATGEYVFLTSPGDYLYDDLVLHDLYRFAKENAVQLCFGNAVFFSDGKLTRNIGVPSAPSVYALGASKKQVDTCFFGGDWVIGAAYFRSRILLQQCLDQISDTAIYMEDTPSTMFALASGESLTHYDRNIIWYEDGTGVSTGASEKWQKLLNKDLLNSLKKLKGMYPRNPWVDIAYINATEQTRPKRLIKKLLAHPILVMRQLHMRCMPHATIRCSGEDRAHLIKLLEEM